MNAFSSQLMSYIFSSPNILGDDDAYPSEFIEELSYYNNQINLVLNIQNQSEETVNEVVNTFFIFYSITLREFYLDKTEPIPLLNLVIKIDEPIEICTFIHDYQKQLHEDGISIKSFKVAVILNFDNHYNHEYDVQQVVGKLI